MTLTTRIFGTAGGLALALGALIAWKPAWAVWLVLAALLAWGLAAPARLTATLLAVMVFVPVTADPGYPVRPVWTVLLVATAIALLGRAYRFDPRAPLASPGLSAMLLPLVATLAALFHWRGPRVLLVALLPFACYAVIVWYVVDEARQDPDAFKRLARGLTWAGVPLLLLALYQRATGTWPVLDELAVSNAFTAHAGPDRAAGTMGHPIIYGTYCMAMICVAIVLRGRLWQVPFAANALGLLLSGSRSAWIGTAAALVVWYLAQRRKVTRRGVATVVGVAVVGAGLAVVGPQPVRRLAGTVWSRLENLTGSSSATARYQRSGQAWSGIWDNAGTVLFGQGPEAHVRFFTEVGIDDGLAQTFDNSYLTLWYDFGAVTVLALVVLLASLLWRRRRSLASRLLVVALAVQAWFFDCFLWPSAVAVLVLAVGLAYATLAPVGPAGLGSAGVGGAPGSGRLVGRQSSLPQAAVDDR